MNIEFETDHFLAAVTIVIVTLEGTEYLMFQKRSDTINQPGDISFPGGHFEKSDGTLRETALREFQEEIGNFELEVIAPLKWHVTLIGAIIEPWVVRLTLSKESDLTFSTQEVSKLILAPLDELLEKGLSKYEFEFEVKKIATSEVNSDKIIQTIHKMRNRAWNHSGYAYELPSGDVVWGVTGEILKTFLDETERRRNKW